MKKNALYSSLIGLKITDVQKDPYSSNSFDATLSNGMKLRFWKQLITIPKAPKSEQPLKEITLLDYLRSLGIKFWYVHKRKNHYRIRIDYDVTQQAIDAIKALKCTDCIIVSEVMKRKYPVSKISLWIRTSIAPSNIIIS